MKKVLVQYLEVNDPSDPKNPNPNNIAEELEKRINQLEIVYKATLFEAQFVGEDYKPVNGTPHDIKFSIPYDKVWKFMLFFREN